jgi:hypothetical protein
MNQKTKNMTRCVLCLGALMMACGGHSLVGEDGTGGTSSGGFSSGGFSNGGFSSGGFSSGGFSNGGFSNGGFSTAGTGTGGQFADPDDELSYDPNHSAGPTCPSACSDAAGTLQTLPTVRDFYAALVGRWQICSGEAAFPGKPEDAIGVEYGPPARVTRQDGTSLLRGNMYYLVAGPAGPERGVGFEYHLTYDVSPQEVGSPPVQLNMHPTPTSGFGGNFLYSPCPLQWSLSGGSANPTAEAILAPFE